MLKVRGHFQRETKITEGRVVAGTAGTHLQVERLVLTDKEILPAESTLLPLTPSANQPLAANFFPTLILAFTQMDVIPETQASTDKLSPMGQLVREAPPISSPMTATSPCCCLRGSAHPVCQRQRLSACTACPQQKGAGNCASLHCKAHQHVFLGDFIVKSNCTESNK